MDSTFEEVFGQEFEPSVAIAPRQVPGPEAIIFGSSFETGSLGHWDAELSSPNDDGNALAKRRDAVELTDDEIEKTFGAYLNRAGAFRAQVKSNLIRRLSGKS